MESEPAVAVPTRLLASLLISATRYAVGRATYIVGETVEAIVTYAPVLDEQTRAVLARDIRDARAAEAGMDCDRVQWRRALAAIGIGPPAVEEETRG